jgi:hypothetical protein
MKTFLTALLFCTLGLLKAQEIPPTFYEHYTGLISDELKITADLIKLENSFSGFYYYEFQEEGVWRPSKPIALDGRVNEDGSFVLNEFGGQSSFFRGELENSKLIKGVWVNEMLKEDVEFAIKATYPTGSINLNTIEQNQLYYFEDDAQKPKAELALALLFPNYSIDQAVFHQLLQKIYHFMGYRGEVSDKTNVISDISSKYNQQFQNALSAIELDSFPESFNWYKSIRMDVVNNEAGLLCLQFDTYAKSGERDGSRVRKYLVFDLNQNKVLGLTDLMNEDDHPTLNTIIEKKIREQYRLKEEQPLSSFGFFSDSITATKNFYIHPGGIGFYYNVYEIAPFSNGSTDVFIPWISISDQVSLSAEVRALFSE